MDANLLPLEFSPSAKFFIDEDGLPVASDRGKFIAIGPEGASVVEGVYGLTGEEPWVREISKEEAFRRANIRLS